MYIVRSFKLSPHGLNLLLIELYLILTLLQLGLLDPDPLVLVAVLESYGPSDPSPRSHSILLQLLLPILVDELLKLRCQHLQLVLQLLILALQLADDQLLFSQRSVRVIPYWQDRIH